MTASYRVKLTGLTPLLMHRDNIDFVDDLKVWMSEPNNKKLSVPGDDRSPAFTWLGYLYDDGEHIAMPSDNIDTDSVAGVGYVVLAEGERVRVSIRDHRRGVKRVGRSVGRIARVRMETLPESERRNAEHASRLMHGTLASLRGAAKEIAIRFAPPEPNPRLKGPK